jgi:hypothetical protein
MERRGDNLRRLEAVAAAQHNVFTREQATAERFTPTMQFDRRRAGDWIQLLPGVYRFAAATPSFRMRCMAATLWSAPDGMISHLCGGARWEFESIRRPLDIDLLLPTERRLGSELVTVHRSRDLLPADRSTRFGIPVASPLRIVLDIASMVDEENYELALEDALRRGPFTVGQLEWRASMRSGKGHPGSRVIADLIRRHGSTVTDSGWEVRLERALAGLGLPRPERQLAVMTGFGLRHVDLGYAGPPIVAFEYDSDRWHSGVRRRHADMERRNALRAADCSVVEVNAALVRDPRALMNALPAHLRSRSSRTPSSS